MICYARQWWKFDTLDWYRMCEDLLFLINKASASSLSDLMQSHEGKHSDRAKAIEVAHAILQDIDNSRLENIDGFRERIETFRRREESASQYNPEHAKQEDEQYSRWREEFDVSESRYSDSLIRRLLKIAGPDNVCDATGFMFWRVRRLMEMQGEEDAKHRAIEAHGGAQLSEEEPEIERAENGANPSHGQSTALSEGPLAIGDGIAETGEDNNDTEHGEPMRHGTTDVPIYRTSILTHN